MSLVRERFVPYVLVADTQFRVLVRLDTECDTVFAQLEEKKIAFDHLTDDQIVWWEPVNLQGTKQEKALSDLLIQLGGGLPDVEWNEDEKCYLVKEGIKV